VQVHGVQIILVRVGIQSKQSDGKRCRLQVQLAEVMFYRVTGVTEIDATF
jgi:hypothetical protein